MKNLVKIVAVLQLFNALPLHGQFTMTPSWIKIDSSINHTSEAWGIDVDINNDIYWAVSNDQLGQGLDIVCYKYQLGGTPVWTSPITFGGAGDQHAYICNVVDSGLFIGGRACPGLVMTCDMLLLKLDKNTGNLVWSKTNNFPANGYDEIDGLEISNNSIYCGGWCQELNSSPYRNDIGLWKLDLDGNTEWTNYLGENLSAEHQDGHFVVDSNYIYAAGLWGGTGIANLYNGYSFLGKFDKSNGNLIDSTLFGHQSSSFGDVENALGMTSDGTYLYITGYTTITSVNDWQIYVAKYDKNLNQIWYTDWGGTGIESARAIKVQDSLIYVGGLTQSSSLITGGGIRDAVLLKLDTAGNFISYQTFGDENDESFQDLAVHDGNIYITGTIESGLYESKSVLVAIEKTTTDIEDLHTNPQIQYTIYPNPATGEIHIEFDQSVESVRQINLYDLKGKLVKSKTIKEPFQQTLFEIENKGVYLVELQFDTYRTARKIVNKN